MILLFPMHNMTAMEDKKLTPKQQLFVEYFIKDLNATVAAIKAWYSEKTASEMWYENLSKPQVMKEVQKSLEKKFKDAWIDGQWVIDQLTSIVKKCLQIEPILIPNKVVDPETKKEEIQRVESIWPYDPSGANTALANLGKYFKLFNDNPNLNLTLTTIVKKIWQKK